MASLAPDGGGGGGGCPPDEVEVAERLEGFRREQVLFRSV
jgi:hypothetical protein